MIQYSKQHIIIGEKMEKTILVGVDLGNGDDCHKSLDELE